MLFRTLLDATLIFIGAAIVVNIGADENIMFKLEAPGIIGYIVTFLFLHIANKDGGYYQIFTQQEETKRHVHAPHVQTKRSKPSYHIPSEEDEEEDEPEYVSPYATKPAKSQASTPPPKKESHSYFEQKKSEYAQQKAKQQSEKQQQRSQQQQQKREEKKLSKFQQELSSALALFTMQEPYTKTDVNTRYKELMLGAHPDRGGKHDDAIKINTARDCLLKNLDERGVK